MSDEDIAFSEMNVRTDPKDYLDRIERTIRFIRLGIHIISFASL